jgi:hypothetical protein
MSKHFKQTLSVSKPMANIFWGMKRLLMAELMQQGTTITLQVHCKTPGPFRKEGME